MRLIINLHIRSKITSPVAVDIKDGQTSGKVWVASVTKGMWYARSPQFLEQPVISTLKWLRIVGNTLFALGLFAFAWFVFDLQFRRSYQIDEEKI